MSDIIYFHNEILPILDNRTRDDREIYLLISLDDTNIAWILRSSKEINEDYVRLIELIMPYGVKVKGFLYFGNETHYVNDQVSNFLRINYAGNRKVISDQLYLIQDLTNTNQGKEISASKFKHITYNPILGVVETTEKNISVLRFTEMNGKIKEEYIHFHSGINTITLANINSYVRNDLFLADVSLYIPDYNILIYDNLQSEEWEELESSNKRKLEKLSSKDFSADIGYTLLFNSTIKDDTYFEETNNTFYSIHQDVADQQKIKSIKMCFSLFISKHELRLQSVYGEILNFSKFISDALDKMNSCKSLTYSLYSYRDVHRCPIPFGILYSYEDTYDLYEEMIQEQRSFFLSVLCLNESNCNKIRRYVLEDKFHENNISVLNNEIVDSKVSSIKNVHQLSSHIPFECDGDYYYYHIGMNNETDRSWGVGYRSLQTVLSWFMLNGHSNIQVPSLSELTKCLPYLGQVNSSLFNPSTYQISLTDIGMILSYVIDSQIEIISIDNIIQYKAHEHTLRNHFENKKSPMILYIHNEDKIFTVLGMNKQGLNILYVLDHSYNGKSTILSLKKGKIFYEISLLDLIKDNNRLEFLMIK